MLINFQAQIPPAKADEPDSLLSSKSQLEAVKIPLQPFSYHQPQSHSLKKQFLHTFTSDTSNIYIHSIWQWKNFPVDVKFPKILHRHTLTVIVDKHMIQSRAVNKRIRIFPPAFIAALSEYILNSIKWNAP